MLAVQLRSEILSARNESELVKNINPVISWENFKPSEGPHSPAELGGLEGDPEWVFAHTFPTSVIKEVLNGLKEKIKGTGAGVFPLDGYLGSGKSHVLLTLYHIFRNPGYARNWFKKWNMDFPEIDEAVVIPIPLQSISYEDLWSPIFKALGVNISVREDDWPKSKEIKRAIADKTVLVLIDEIDNWYDAKSNREKARIRGFLQSLSEVSEYPECQLNLVISFLGLSDDVKVLRDIVARPRGGSSIVMQRTEDMFDIVRFRLFESIDEEKAEFVIMDYLKKVSEELKKKGLDVNAHLKDDLKRSYPFHPAFLRTLSALRVRQMLVMLAVIVKRKMDKTDIIIASDLDDDILRKYLHSLDQKVVDAYFEDINFIQNTREIKERIIPFELARAILLTCMLNTIETKKGADIKDIIFGCGTKYTIQDIEDTINFLEKWTRLKKVEEEGIVRYIITTELPVAVKIERKAELVPNDEALKRIKEMLRTVVTSEIKGYTLLFDRSKIRNDKHLKILTLLEKPSNILSVYPDDFTRKNTLYVLYPSYSLKSDEIIRLAKRVIASEILAETEIPDKPFKEFHKEYMKALRRQIDNAGWIGCRWFRKNLKDKPILDERTITSLKDVDQIIKNYASPDLLKYFLNMILDEQGEISVGELKERLYRLEGAPILLKEENLLSLLSKMQEKGEIAIKTSQGRIIYKKPLPFVSIGNEDIIQMPLEKAVPPSRIEVITEVRDRKRLSFKEFSEEHPFIDQDVLEKVFLSAIDVKEGIYCREGNRILSKPEKVRASELMVKEKAAEILEPLIIRAVREKIAIRLSDLTDLLKDTYGNSGVTEGLVLAASENLEIAGRVSLLRKQKEVVIQLPEDYLLEEIKKKIFFRVKKEGEIKKNIIVENLANEFPVEPRIFEEAIASLIDERKLHFDKDSGKLSLPTKEREGIREPIRRILIKQEGTPSEILKEIEDLIEDSDVIQGMRVEFLEDLPAKEFKKIIRHLGENKVRVVARRKEM